MSTTKNLLLAGTMLTGLAALPPLAVGAEAPFIVAQAQPDAIDRLDRPDRPDRPERPRPPGERREAPPARPGAAPPGAPPPAAQPPAATRPAPQPPAAQERRAPQRPAAEEHREAPPQRPAQERPAQPPAAGRPAPQAPAAQERREPQRPAAEERREAPPQRPAAQERPVQPPAASRPEQPAAPTAQDRPAPGQPPAIDRPGQPPAAQGRPPQPTPPAVQAPGRPQPPAAEGRPAQPTPPAAQGTPQPTPPAVQTAPARPQPPAAGQPTPPAAQAPIDPARPSTAGQPPAPAAQGRPGQPTPPPAAHTAPAPGAQPPATAQTPAAAPPPVQPRDSHEFLHREGGQPEQRIDQVRQERHEVREGNRTFIREPGRVIIREGGRTIIRHNEADRFAVDARDVRVERRGAETYSIIERPDGVRIITVTDEEGHLIRRVRRDPGGAEVVIIDNSFAPRPRGRPVTETYFVDLPPPAIRIPRERYIVEAERASPDEVYEVLVAPPVERIGRRYTLDQVRYSHPLRERMPRIDLDITFDTGSWVLTPDQLDRLDLVANGIRRAVAQNPREVFMIEGHTDAVGNDIDNLSLSDRRAESVAVALTERYQVPAENLVTQGYGEQYLKVNTQAAERANRRVTVRRITPLIDEQAANSTGRR